MERFPQIKQGQCPGRTRVHAGHFLAGLYLQCVLPWHGTAQEDNIRKLRMSHLTQTPLFWQNFWIGNVIILRNIFKWKHHYFDKFFVSTNFELKIQWSPILQNTNIRLPMRVWYGVPLYVTSVIYNLPLQLFCCVQYQVNNLILQTT